MENPLHTNIAEFVDKTMAVEDGDSTVSDGVKRMEYLETYSLLVRDGGHLKGIVTYRDILFDVVAKGRDPTRTKLREIMRTPLHTIQKNSRVLDAISLMRKHNIRRLLVLDNESPVGMLTQKTLAGNITKSAVPLPELEMPNKIRCPYCSSIFDDKAKLSEHIDDIHIGRGLFEGNLSRAEDLGSISPPSDFPKTL